MATPSPSKSTSSTASTSQHPRPIILVTGANAGLGFASCQRLLLQLSSPEPSDTLPDCPGRRSPDVDPKATPFSAPHGCTLLLACRNAIKAHKARRALVEMLDRLGQLPDEIPTPTTPEELQKLGVARPTGGKETIKGREPDSLLGGSTDDESDDGSIKRAGSANQLRKRRMAKSNGGTAASSSTNSPPASPTSSSGYEPRLDDDIDLRQARARGKYRRSFCKGTKIEFVPLDLGSMASVLTCAKQVSERHPYLTHLINNAGGAAFEGINWPLAVWMMLTEFQTALTRPRFKKQRSGDLSQDGFGWVWQINVGGHWTLTQSLLPLLRQSPYSTPSRVVFTGSVEAMREAYDADDFQCLSTAGPSKAYESTKYQCDLAALALQQQLEEEETSSDKTKDAEKGWSQPQVYLTHPGVVATSIMAEWLNIITATAMLWSFYFARWTFSPHHCVAPYKGSISHSHISLAPSPDLNKQTRYGSQCDFWGREYVASTEVDGWGKDGGEEVLQLAREWKLKADGVLKKVRRDSNAGSLPPGRRLVDSEQDEVEVEDEKAAFRASLKQGVTTRQAEKEVDEWEKVDQQI